MSDNSTVVILPVADRETTYCVTILPSEIDLKREGGAYDYIKIYSHFSHSTRFFKLEDAKNFAEELKNERNVQFGVNILPVLEYKRSFKGKRVVES